MNRIVLIGNGFDLAHGLKTSYHQFLDWYGDTIVRDLRDNKSQIYQNELCYFKDQSGRMPFKGLIIAFGYDDDPKKMSWKKFLSLIKKYKYDYQLSPFFERINDVAETKGWVDIENEYYKLLTQYAIVDCDEEAVKSLNKQLTFLKGKWAEYLSSINMDHYHKIESINKKIYDLYKLEDISIEGLRLCYGENPFSLQDQGRLMLLSFNYTKTVEWYLINDPYCEFVMIHGSINDPKSMIFGYGDEQDKSFVELLNHEDNECLRFVKSMRYLESRNYKRVLKFIDSAPFQVYIMGHSCGTSDRTLLNTIFEHRNCVSIKPYYHDKGKGNDNYLELIQNIGRNFTDMKLMRDRVVDKEDCEPLLEYENGK